MKKLVLMAAIAGLSLTLLFAQTDSTNSSKDPLETLREKRAQLNNPQSVTQSKIFLLQQKECEAKAEAAKARAEEASNRAKAAKNKAAEPPTATEKANRPAYDQRRLELAAEQAEAEAEAAQAEAEAAQAQVDALKAKVEVSKAKADEVRTSPYRRAQSKYYDAQWQEQLEKKTLDEQAAASKEAALKARVASEASKRAKMARDTARKNSMALAAKKSGVPAVKQETTSANDEELARRAHELELAQAKAEKEAAAASERAKKKEAAAAAAAAKENARKEKDAAKKADAEKSAAAARESAAAAKEVEYAKQAEAAKKADEAAKKAELAAKKVEEARQTEAEVEAARKQQVEEARRIALANDEARKAEAQADAIRKQKEEAGRKAAEIEKQMQDKKARDAKAREAKASADAAAAAAKKKKEKPALVSLRSQLPVDPSEVENDVQGKALEALRRKQAELDLLESQTASAKSGTKTVAVKASEPVASTPAPTVAVNDDNNSAQAKALEALRKKQAELDAEEAKVRSTAMSAKERAKAEAQRSTDRETKQQQLAAAKAAKAAKEAEEARAEETAKAAEAAQAAKAAEAARAARAKKTQVAAVASTKPVTKADELDAALTKKAEPVVAPAVKIDTAAIDAESKKLETLRQRQADLRAQQVKIKTDLQNAVRNASEKKGKGEESLELIVDNPAARPTGTWMNGKTRGYYGSDYLWKGKGTGANYVKFVPVIPVAGEYEVYEWHIAGTNRASDTPHIISYSGGTQTILVNQQLNGSKWNLLGKFNFAQGSSGEIRVTDGISTSGQMIMADAVRFVAANGGGSTTGVVETNSKELEDLRKQQASLDAELTKLKEEIAATDKRLADLKAGNEKAQIQAAEQEAVRNANVVKESTESNATRVAVKADTKADNTKAEKTNSKKQPVKTPTPTLTADETSALTPKEQKLADLLRRYKNDEITPHEYHQMRAKIIAEP